MKDTYKISYVVLGKDHPGAIQNTDHRPEIGERVKLGVDEFIVAEIFDLVPARGSFHYLHATLQAERN
ncbi:MAG: hypothetical protein JXA97_05740 [Anaerolineales bacterium]|nr:hypothetical protein [Anaerolineales bacterium]